MILIMDRKYKQSFTVLDGHSSWHIIHIKLLTSDLRLFGGFSSIVKINHQLDLFILIKYLSI